MKKKCFLSTIKTLVIIIFYFFSPFNCLNSQGWELFIGDVGKQERAQDIVATNDGNYAVLIYCSNVAANHFSIRLLKINVFGEILWQRSLGSWSTIKEEPKSLALTNDGGFIIGGDFGENIFLIKTNSEGQEEWRQNIGASHLNESLTKIIQTVNGDYAYVGKVNDDAISSDVLIGRFDNFGQPLWSTTFGSEVDENPTQDGGLDLIELRDGNFLATGFYHHINANFVLFKVDVSGNEVWSFSTEERPMGFFLHELENKDFIALTVSNFILFDSLGTSIQTTDIGDFDIDFEAATSTLDHAYVITGSLRSSIGNNRAILLQKVDSLGSVIWRKTFEPSIQENKGTGVVATPDGGFIVSGYKGGQEDVYIVKVNSEGEIYSNEIRGKVGVDALNNCATEEIETGLANWIITATNENHYFTTTSDENGYYTILVDTGTYTLRLHSPIDYWEACMNDVEVQFLDYDETDTIDFFLNSTIECPYLSVDISTPFLRRCFPNRYSVSYCNMGTILAQDVFLEITLDEFTRLDSTSIPWTFENNNTYTFLLGDLAVGACDFFHLFTTLDCDSTFLGQTHCVEAHIFPDSLCFLPNPLWNGASLSVSGDCVGDSIQFRIINEGSGDMDEVSNFSIMVDEVIMMQGDLLLPSGNDTIISIFAHSATYRIEVEQVLGHPGLSQPSSTIEACPNLGSTGFVNWFDQNDADDFIDIDCQPSRGAFDPNDKKAFPKGYENQHFIERDTEIEYLIRFQNTGTDTAFLIKIEDNLSPFLDIGSLRMGAASHPYTWSLSDENLLIITFSNVMLPDSTVNEQASHGFVQFKIKPQRGLSIGTTITNRANIFFDFNLPILTNLVFHTIGKDFVAINTLLNQESLPIENIFVHVAPNPFNQQTLFEIPHHYFDLLELDIYNAQGQWQKCLKGKGNQLFLRKENLLAGIYFYQLKGNNNVLSYGKLVVF